MCGLRSEATQKHLLSKSDLTLKRALEIAQSQEAAERNTQQLKEGDISTLSVESITVSCKKECYRCRGRNHLPWECHHCGRKGHIAKACRSKGEPAKSKFARKRAETGGRAKWVQADKESDCAEDELEDSMVYKIKDSEARPITVHLHINGIHLKMEVDTGAAVSTISEQTQKNFFPNALLQRTSIKLRT